MSRRLLPQPKMQPVQGERRKWRLLEAYAYRDVEVPADFVWDRASTPGFMENDDGGEAAPLIHDRLYQLGGRLNDGADEPPTYTRAQADALFREVMLADGVGRWTAWKWWAGVRLFAAAAWRSPEAIMVNTWMRNPRRLS